MKKTDADKINWQKLAEINHERTKSLAKAFAGTLTKLGFYSHVHDEDCPKCEFPETLIVRETKGHTPMTAYCTHCGWTKKLKSKPCKK